MIIYESNVYLTNIHKIIVNNGFEFVYSYTGVNDISYRHISDNNILHLWEVNGVVYHSMSLTNNNTNWELIDNLLNHKLSTKYFRKSKIANLM